MAFFATGVIRFVFEFVGKSRQVFVMSLSPVQPDFLNLLKNIRDFFRPPC
jgi:hypothetical protein